MSSAGVWIARGQQLADVVEAQRAAHALFMRQLRPIATTATSTVTDIPIPTPFMTSTIGVGSGISTTTTTNTVSPLLAGMASPLLGAARSTMRMHAHAYDDGGGGGGAGGYQLTQRDLLILETFDWTLPSTPITPGTGLELHVGVTTFNRHGISMPRSTTSTAAAAATDWKRSAPRTTADQQYDPIWSTTTNRTTLRGKRSRSTRRERHTTTSAHRNVASMTTPATTATASGRGTTSTSTPMTMNQSSTTLGGRSPANTELSALVTLLPLNQTTHSTPHSHGKVGGVTTTPYPSSSMSGTAASRPTRPIPRTALASELESSASPSTDTLLTSSSTTSPSASSRRGGGLSSLDSIPSPYDISSLHSVMPMIGGSDSSLSTASPL
jgi:hypothetical protein